MPEPDRGGLGSAAPRPDRPRFPCFDGFRALAATGVMLTHVAFIGGLYANDRDNVAGIDLTPYLANLDLGVAIFFLISGFLLYRPFVAAHLERGSVLPTGAFYKRRALRIFPAYWLCLTITAFVLHAPSFDDAQAAFLHYTLLHVYSVDNALGGPVQQSWTLSAELAFYLLLPGYAWLLARKPAATAALQVRRELAGVALLYAGSFAFRTTALVLSTDRARDGMMINWLPSQLDLFAIGMGVAVVSVWLARTDRPTLLARPFAPALSWCAAAAVFWVACNRLDLPPDPTAFSAWQHVARQFLFGIVALLVLLPGVFGPQDRGVVRGFLRNPVVQWVGLVSYGIYLWHETWLDEYRQWTDTPPFTGPFLEMTAFMVVLTVISAAVSYYVVERPALRLKDRPLLRRRPPAADRNPA